MLSSALMKAYLGSNNDGDASWTINGVRDPSKVRKWRVAKSQIVLLIIIIRILILIK